MKHKRASQEDLSADACRTDGNSMRNDARKDRGKISCVYQQRNDFVEVLI